MKYITTTLFICALSLISCQSAHVKKAPNDATLITENSYSLDANHNSNVSPIVRENIPRDVTRGVKKTNDNEPVSAKRDPNLSKSLKK